MPSILDIEDEISGLSDDERELFERLFSVQVNTGRLKIPRDMSDWVEDTFGSVKDVEEQKIVRVTNESTHDTALFNELRAQRPMVGSGTDVQREIDDAAGGSFCNPEESTPEDVFGRIQGDHGVTASNVAKYDAWHGMVVFDEHDPLKFTEEQVVSRLQTAKEWLERVHKKDEEAIYPLIIWQCLWKAAASIVHGHMQMLLTSDSHYGGIRELNRVRQDYITNFGTDYFGDLFRVHESLGLGLEDDEVKVMASLTPAKEKEVMIIAPELSEGVGSALYRTLETFRDDFGVQSFTIGIMMPPLIHEHGWEGFPVVVRIIDRGSLDQKTADVGTLELLGVASVVASDPYKVFEKLKTRF